MKCTSPNKLWVSDLSDENDIDKPITVPCGKCIPCLQSKRLDWQIRLEQEHKVSKGAHFVTLTYDYKNLPFNQSLSKRHVQLYLKRLRKSLPTHRIRYYAVGEYGTRYHRPHYHLLIFNAVEKNIRQAWDKGIVHVGNVTTASVGYITKYIVQPPEHLGEKARPFSLMSRGYGLGAHYLTDEMVAWHREDDRNYMVIQGKKTKLPRFYKEKIFTCPIQKAHVSNESKWQAIKEERRYLRKMVKKHGKAAKRIIAEQRLAAIQRVKIKVAYSQTL